MIKDIVVIDDLVNEIYQVEIEQALLAEMGPAWFLLDDVAYPGQAVKHRQPGIVHPMFEENKGIMSPLYHLAVPLVYEAVTRINFKFKNIIRGRSFIQFPTPASNVNHAHIDTNESHLVVLYYVNDADGETVIYNQTADDIPNLPGFDTQQLSVKQRVSPKRGRVVMFNGRHYHSSSTPTTNKRCVINFDISGFN